MAQNPYKNIDSFQVTIGVGDCIDEALAIEGTYNQMWYCITTIVWKHVWICWQSFKKTVGVRETKFRSHYLVSQ